MNKIINHNNKLVFSSLTTLAVLLIAFSTFAQQDKSTPDASFTFTEPLSVDKNQPEHGGRNRVIFLTDSTGQHYVLKYNYDTEGSIREILGAHIGSHAGIPINKVKIIPPHTNIIGIDTCSNIATLHTRVPGAEANTIPTINETISLNGQADEPIFASLTKHPDLCSITALDVFLNNFDRHNGNLFFDEKNNRFYAIDMDYIFPNVRHSKITSPSENVKDIFREPVAERAHSILMRICQSKELTTQEVDALTQLSTTLTTLTKSYPLEKIYELWMDIAKQASHTYTQEKKSCIKIALLYNSYRVENFLDLLNGVINKHKQSQLP